MGTWKLHLRLIRFLGVLVPLRLRADWRQEWEAELRYREQILTEWENLTWRTRISLLWQSLGAFFDALWMQSYRWEDEMIQDLRFGVRMLRKTPGFTAIAVLSLMLGIGANSAIFSVVNAVLLEPLPFANPSRLFMVRATNSELAKTDEDPSPGDFLDLRDQRTVLESLTAWYVTARTLRGEHDSEQLNSALVSTAFFQTLGVKPALGRVFLPVEGPGVAFDNASQYVSGDRVIVMSDGLWRRRFGADPGIVGKPVMMNGLSWQVIGVMPAGFAALDQGVDLWEPWDLERTYGEARFPAGPPRDWRFLKILGRLKSGVTPEQARMQLDSLSAALAERYPKSNRGWRMTLTSFHDEVVGATRRPLLLLFVAVGMTLLVACANVAGLLAARAAARRREIAIRSALGASRRRLFRQFLTESVLLAFTGGLLGLGLTIACKDLIVSLAPSDIARIDEVAIDGRVIGFTLLLSVLTGVVFGLIPALKGAKTDLTRSLKAGGVQGANFGAEHHRFLKAMIVTEIAVALTLLVGAGLSARSFTHLLSVDPGFDSKNLLTMHITLDGAAYRGRAAEYYQRLIDRLEALPGVVSAAAVTTLPMSNIGVDFDRPYWREGDPQPSGDGDKVDVRMSTPGYFNTMGMTLIRGRQFGDHDRRDTPAVIIVNENMAVKVWPGEDPIGKRLILDYNRGKYAYEVVGVTRGISYYGLRSRPQPEVFIPHAQNAYLPMNVVVRTAVEPGELIKSVKDELRALDPAQPAHNLMTMEQFINRSLAPDRFSMWLLWLLSALALLLAVTGVYGVMSYAVSQRRYEFGVRMALGATSADVKQIVLKQGLKLSLLGVGIGVAGALAATRLIKSLLFDVSPTDPITFFAVTLILLLAALGACLPPAYRASRVDPLESLRGE
jgi:putative ABC transport system permease protein